MSKNLVENLEEQNVVSKATPIYDLAALLDEVNDMLEERRAIEGKYEK